MKCLNYILDGKRAIPCDDTILWGKWFSENMDTRIVGKDSAGGYDISTVFLGLDHEYGDGPPLIFETMIFTGDEDDYLEGRMWRYSTWDEAEEGHKAAIEFVKNHINKEKV